MQIKLKQGIGRAIRTETDTCVISILDMRAHKNQNYHYDALKAIPPMPITSDIAKVKSFLCSVKESHYFI